MKIQISNQNFNLGLLKAGFNLQSLADQSMQIDVNEDNIQLLNSHINTCNQVIKVLKEVHKNLKAPHKAECDKLDAELKEITSIIEQISKKDAYVSLCQEIERRRLEQQALIANENRIKKGIESNIAAFMQVIANATDELALNKAEQSINLEKGRAVNKCGEILGNEYLKLLNNLTVAIKEQKSKIAALKKDETVTQETITQQLEESKKEIISTSIINKVEIAQPIMPVIKPKRQQWKVEIADVKKAIQHHADILDVFINPKLSIDLLNEFKKSDNAKGREEYISNGLRFYLDKTY